MSRNENDQVQVKPACSMSVHRHQHKLSDAEVTALSDDKLLTSLELYTYLYARYKIHLHLQASDIRLHNYKLICTYAGQRSGHRCLPIHVWNYITQIPTKLNNLCNTASYWINCVASLSCKRFSLLYKCNAISVVTAKLLYRHITPPPCMRGWI
jgi:hypothetical protein